MKFRELAKILDALERTSSRLQMIAILKGLFLKTPPEVIDKVALIITGKLYPEFREKDLGIGEKLTMRAISEAYNVPLSVVESLYKKLGDLGRVAEELCKRRKRQASSFIIDVIEEPLTVDEVRKTLDKIADISGEGAIEKKIRLLAGLLSRAEPNEAKHIVRLVLRRMRLGVAESTVLEALADAFLGAREYKELLERAYYVYPDIGYIAKVVATEGREGIMKIRPQLGIPIKMMLAHRAQDLKEIFLKVGRPAAFEYKYDGERAQIHVFKDGTVKIFSRHLEDITAQYPDIVEGIRKALEGHEAIVEGEIVAYDPDTDELRPFQELMRRKRKYEIERVIEEIPVRIYLFDLIYLDGEPLLDTPYNKRRELLENTVKPNERVTFAERIVTDDVKEAENFFHKSIADGCEGIMAKKLDSPYQAGVRGRLWIKYKRDYHYELSDTVDLVVVGAFMGRGRRAGTYGALLMAAYDKETDTFKTVCKLGSGFTDEDLQKLPKMLEPYKVDHKPARVESELVPDVRFLPAVVAEVAAAEITRSPIHTCYREKLGTGLALRFPRFVRRREDKGPEDATTCEELYQMFLSQRKKKIIES